MVVAVLDPLRLTVAPAPPGPVIVPEIVEAIAVTVNEAPCVAP
jgi:hypothetical protein